jgi:hypothetical protein
MREKSGTGPVYILEPSGFRAPYLARATEPALGRRLDVVMPLAQGLPVAAVPEDFGIAFVRHFMVDDLGLHDPSLGLACRAPGVLLQVGLALFPPPAPVSALHSAAARRVGLSAIVCPVPLAFARVTHECVAAGMVAGVGRRERHQEPASHPFIEWNPEVSLRSIPVPSNDSKK